MVADVAIAGGGPAGAALAIELGRRGIRVNLYEKARHPRLKACGEGLLPHGVAALGDIAGLPDAPRVRGLRFVAGGASTDADFPDGFGLVVRRDWFDAWLFEQARPPRPTSMRAWERPYRSEGERFVVGADGRNSIFHRRLEAQRRPAARALASPLTSTGLEDVSDRVEVFFHREGELYVAPTGGGETLVAALFHQRPLPSRRHHSSAQHDSRDPRSRAAGRVHDAGPRGFAAGAAAVTRGRSRRLLLIGDAAGAPDPITGDGIAMAMASVKPAADAIVSGDLAAYERVRLAMGRNADRLGRLLLAVSRAEGRALTRCCESTRW